MEAKEKGAITTPEQNHDKGSKLLIKQQVRKLFYSGKRFTAVQLNQLIGFNDARKVISMLRAEYMVIKDVRLDNGCKLYWWVPQQEKTLFDGLWQ